MDTEARPSPIGTVSRDGPSCKTFRDSVCVSFKARILGALLGALPKSEVNLLAEIQSF